jgi:lipoprotein NlpI
MVGSPTATGWRSGLPWAVAGAALGALITVVVMRGARSEAPPPEVQQESALRAPDISQMSPEERATRLFNRIMILDEAGKRDSVRFFFPMAVNAYSQLPAMDVDARYHLGLIQLAGGQPSAALAQADTILRATPTHLFGFVLRARAYGQTGNRQGEQRAHADFLKNEAAELARNRPEYAEHRELSAFRTQAARGSP